MKNPITVSAVIDSPIENVWEYWTNPSHITQWCFASSDWCAPKAENDLRIGGTFTTRMEAKDGSFGFDFGGVYTKVIQLEIIAYVMEDGRKVEILFSREGNNTRVIETFDPEDENPVEMQQGGWQSILDNFKAYVESEK